MLRTFIAGFVGVLVGAALVSVATSQQPVAKVGEWGACATTRRRLVGATSPACLRPEEAV